jgi:phage/plasmid primase-like uncharacterized protein
MTATTTKDVAAALNGRIAELARQLCGEPNRDLSNAQQLRFGTRGSVAVEIAGDGAGRWFDHEQRVGGDGLEMVKQRRGLTNGAALDWARQWLGWPPGRTRRRKISAPEPPPVMNIASMPAPDTPPPAPAPQTDPPQTGMLSGDAQAAGGDGNGDPWVPTSASNNAKKIAEDAKRAAKVAQIVASSKDPHGTRVEIYLRRRGITQTPLPPSICYLPHAYNGYGALVALATDAQGQVQGLQQIYLTDDGRKAPLKVQKRTNKARDGWSDIAAVRMPGHPPIILCEGVETALSVWQATGQETWACLGISNIGRAPLPDGVPVIIARDGDEPNSKADQQLRQAVTMLRSQGRDVSVAEPPPGQDFNDILQSGGDETVRMLIATTRPAKAFSDEWRKDLLLNEDGEPRPVLANAITALRGAPEWDGVLWHDVFATTTVARKPLPWMGQPKHWTDTPWADRDDALVANWLQHQEIMVPMSIAGQTVEVVSRDKEFHPVREYLDALIWDGIPRLDLWLLQYLGAEDTPYHRAIGPRWLISAIARIYIPAARPTAR